MGDVFPSPLPARGGGRDLGHVDCGPDLVSNRVPSSARQRAWLKRWKAAVCGTRAIVGCLNFVCVGRSE